MLNETSTYQLTRNSFIYIVALLLCGSITGLNLLLTPSVSAVLPTQGAQASSTVNVVQGLTMTVTSSNLTISNLVPGYAGDSDPISIIVGSNTPYGYNLTASVGEESGVHNTTDLVGVSGNFTTLTDSVASKEDFDDDKWGYAYSLTGNDNDWTEYNGLPLHTEPLTLRKTESPAEETIHFKIAAKAGLDREAGSYSNVINFTATANPKPMKSIEDVFAAIHKPKVTVGENSYYRMQDMSPAICSMVEGEDEATETQLIDVRDNNIYWVTKLQDGKCWMTQNLDLNLVAGTPLTSNDTDLTSYGSNGYTTSYGYSKTGDVISWTPATGTLNATTKNNYNGLVTGSSWSAVWGDDNKTYNQKTAQSMDVGIKYQKGTYFSSSNCNYITSTCTNFIDKPDSVNGTHGAIGNYYNWNYGTATPVKSLC